MKCLNAHFCAMLLVLLLSSLLINNGTNGWYFSHSMAFYSLVFLLLKIFEHVSIRFYSSKVFHWLQIVIRLLNVGLCSTIYVLLNLLLEKIKIRSLERIIK